MTLSPRITVFTNTKGLLTKRAVLGTDGSLRLSPAAELYAGAYEVREAATPAALRDIISTLSTSQAIAHGVPRNASTAGTITTKANRERPALARSRDDFGWSEGAGWLMLDIDAKDVAASVKGSLPVTVDGFRELLVQVVPALADAPMVATPSAGACLYRTLDNATLRGLTGVRVYIQLATVADTATVGNRIADALVLAGYGYAHVFASGAVRVRTILDTSVWSPERLDFIAGASCGEGVEQRRGPVLVWNDGLPALATGTIPAPDAAAVARIRRDLLRAAEPEALRRKAAYLDERKARGLGTSLTWSGNGQTVEVLRGEHEIEMTDGSTVTVNALLDDPTAYDGKTCHDPMEPAYGGGDARIAKVYTTSSPAGPNIHSFAHGGAVYLLEREAADDFADAAEGGEATTTKASAAEAMRSARPRLDEFNARYAVVDTHAPAVLSTPGDGRQPGFLSPEGFRMLTKPDRVLVGKSSRPLSELWLEWDERRRYRCLVYDPTLPPLAGHGAVFNMWPGFAVSPLTDASDEGVEGCDRFFRHLREVVAAGDADVYRWVEMWLADMVQNPQTPPMTSLVLRGAHGSGKSIVGLIMGQILGSTLFSAVEAERLTAAFNGFQAKLLLLQVEEAHALHGDKRAQGTIKNAITAKTKRVEEKYEKSFEVPNYMRLLMTANAGAAVSIEIGERRFTVLDVASTYSSGGSIDTYFAPLIRMAEGRDLAAVRRVLARLMAVQIDSLLIRRPILTAALENHKLDSMPQDQQWLYDILWTGQLPDAEERDPSLVRRETLIKSFSAAMHNTRAGARSSSVRMATSLGQLLPNLWTEKKRGPRGAQERVIAFAPLAECRAVFGKRGELTWPDDPHEWEHAPDPFAAQAGAA